MVWRDKLIASARKEFEDARHERDPDIIARLLIGPYPCLRSLPPTCRSMSTCV